MFHASDPPKDAVDDPRRAELRRVYVRLGTGELAAAAVFALVAVVTVSPRLAAPQDRVVLWAVLAPLEAVLLAAGAYWLLARRWVQQSPMPSGLARGFRVIRVFTVLLLASGLCALVVWWPAQLPVAALMVIVWLFAVVEFINYYWVRLAYPPRAWPAGLRARRAARLARDVRAARPRLE